MVTCADDRVYDDLLVPFLASLFSVAKWRGRVAVLDYGLAAPRVARLRRFGVKVERVRHATFVNLDRFLHLADFCRRHPGLISHWDADMWFCGKLCGLFDHFERKHGRRLLCSVDWTLQNSCYGVALNPAGKQKLKRVLDGICRKHGSILQCAFICGPSAIIRELCEQMAKMIRHRAIKPVWNSDTVGLNYYGYEHPERVEVIPPVYNCLPDWGPEARGKNFYCGTERVRVLHITSPYRCHQAARNLTFQVVHPRLYRRWLMALSSQ